MRWGCVIRFLIIRKRAVPIPQAEGAYRDGVNYQSVNVLGYENFQGNKAEWLQYVTVNKTAADGRWFITMPDGTERVVQGITVYNADIYPTHMVWGRYMDLIAAKEGGSTSSHWFDRFYVVPGFLVWCIGRTTTRSR